MKKIAIFTCLKANECCTGAACLAAFNHRQAAFSIYAAQEVELAAFSRCNGCGQDGTNNKGFKEKLNRLLQLDIEALHIGICTQQNGLECPMITKLIEIFQQAGITVIRGCHE